jgi:hypothetical protein
MLAPLDTAFEEVTTVKNRLEVFQKQLNIALPCDPEALLLNPYPNELKTETQRSTCLSVSIAASGAMGKGGHKSDAHRRLIDKENRYAVEYFSTMERRKF